MFRWTLVIMMLFTVVMMIQRCLCRKYLRTMLLLPVLLQLTSYVVHILFMVMSERILQRLAVILWGMLCVVVVPVLQTL